MTTALTLDIKQDGWAESKGFIKRDIDTPHLDYNNPADAASVIVKVRYAGMCGSDRGIWHRCAFTNMFHDALDRDGKELRILGHEFVGEVVEAGTLVNELYGIKVGDAVSGDSHITCGKCFQCHIGEQEVCQDQKILGISTDGIFAGHVKIPAKNLWVVDYDRVRPEICALYDPFGNAVHALTKTDVRGARVAIFGCGQIGMFSILLAKQFGAAEVIAIDVNEKNLETAKQLGAQKTILIEKKEKAHDYEHDPEVIQKINEYTDGKGVDISMEMAGYNSSVNNCIRSTRSGGEIILFGIKDGNFTVPNFSDLIVKGITLRSIIGREIFRTWQIGQRVLSDKTNGVQDKIWKIIMNEGKETVIPISSFTPELIEARMKQWPKLIFDFSK